MQLPANIQSTIDGINFTLLPDDLSISTMTITCRLPIAFHVQNIAHYVDLNPKTILSIKHGRYEDQTTNRSLIPKKKSGKANHKSFYNQVSLKVKTTEKTIDIKLFTNGSIQMTGCKSVSSALESLMILFNELHVSRGTFDYKNKKIIDIDFVDNINTLNISSIIDFKIGMINSNFNIGYRVNRDKLYQLLQDAKECDCVYDPVVHACVNIKYNKFNEVISIFVFESGSIIITGARDCNQILNTYEFVNRLLLKNYKKLVSTDIIYNLQIARILFS